MSILDSITAPVASAGAAVLGYLGQQKTNDDNAEIAASNNAWSAEQYAKRYQTMTADLKSAGLNPMLAYSQSPGSAPTAQAVQFQNPMSAATQGYQQVASASQANAEVDRVKQSTAYIEQQTQNLKEEFKNIPLTGNQINMFVAKMESERQLLLQKKLTEVEAGNQIRAMISKIDKETRLLTNQVEVEDSLSNIGRYSKELGPISQLLLNAMRSLK
jgi:hypothetical protein